MLTLSGMVYYTNCEAKLYKVKSKGFKHYKEHVVCATYLKKVKHNCTFHQVRNGVFEKLLLDDLHRVTDFSREYEE